MLTLVALIIELYWVGRFATGLSSVVSIIGNVFTPNKVETKSIADKIRARLILRWIKGVSRVFHKLPKTLDGTYTSISFAS